jgi:hypothetical protein
MSKVYFAIIGSIVYNIGVLVSGGDRGHGYAVSSLITVLIVGGLADKFADKKCDCEEAISKALKGPQNDD